MKHGKHSRAAVLAAERFAPFLFLRLRLSVRSRLGRFSIAIEPVENTDETFVR
jgi:hypothetical protein